MKKQNLKSNKGITLVALVITIIILLILAVVAINAVNGDGIIGKAKYARAEYEGKADEEQGEIDKYDSILYEITTGKTKIKDYAKAEKDTNGLLKEVAAYSDGTSTAYIPAGFKLLDENATSTTKTISTGLVITDGTSEFVWIPVDNIDTMARLQDGSTTDYRGVLYDWKTIGHPELTWPSNIINYKEPDILTNASYADGNSEYLLSCTEDKNNDTKVDYTDLKIQLQEEFNSMVGSVAEYHGFYVGRYEMSLSSGGKALSTKDADSANPRVSSCNMWYGLYDKAKTFESSSVTSSMIYGCQYDAMMKWMEKADIDVTATSFGTEISKNTSGTKTGQDEDKDILNNVYDLLGGHREWTQGLYINGNEYRAWRGSLCSENYYPAYYNGAKPNSTKNDNGTRLVLYINL